MIFPSPLKDITVPEIPLAQFILEQTNSSIGDKPALVEGVSGQALSYEELRHKVGMVAANLTRRGFKKGEVFAICCPNLPEFAIAIYAVWSLGGIITPVSPAASPAEVAFQLMDTKAAYLLTLPSLVDKFRPVLANSQLHEVFVLGAGSEATSFSILYERVEGAVVTAEINVREDLALIAYSSGTSGSPKGALFTHYNLLAALTSMGALEDYTAEDCLIGLLPFFHVAGLLLVNLGLLRGTTIICLPRFELELFLGLMQKYRVSHAFLAPPVVSALAYHPLVANYDLSGLKSILCSAAPLSAAIEQACARRLGCVVRQGLGMTEACGAITIPPADPARIKPGSTGPAVPNLKYKIIDVQTGQELEAGQPGEIWVASPALMQGYLNQPEATSQTIDHQGWLHTGDLGYADDEGYLYVVDRLKDLIKYKGHQVVPQELEQVLLQHPAVAEAAVVRSRDEQDNEVPKAFVVTRKPVTSQELLDFVAERVSPYKKLRQLEFIDQLPKSPSGKILRRVLSEPEKA
jgi:acyl-CoA synthetase (AMP-forming)/AMP-acid ligase II